LIATRHFSIAAWPGFCYADAVALGAQLPVRLDLDTDMLTSGLRELLENVETNYKKASSRKEKQ
jgi:hypothetical protein